MLGNIDGAAHSIDHAHELRRIPIANRFDDRPLCSEIFGRL
jgi:hypothetical protein